MEIVRLHLGKIGALKDIPVHGFVIKHPRAGAILVDTGMGSSAALIKEWRIVNRGVAEALAEHDLSPADVKIVVNSHLHFDHCGQNAVFRHAPFYIQRSELERAYLWEESTVVQWFDFGGAKYELLDGDAPVAEGVRVVATPGHTVGHQSVFVEADDGEAVMIGDAAYTGDIYRDVEKADLSEWPGQHANRDDWERSLVKVHAMRPHSVHFCHDTRVIHS